MATVEGVEALFAENLRRRRKQAGLSQAEVMEKMTEAGFAYHQSTVAKIETGTRLVRISEAVELAKILGVDLDRLLREFPDDVKLRAELTEAQRRVVDVEMRHEDAVYELNRQKTELANAEVIWQKTKDRLLEAQHEFATASTRLSAAREATDRAMSRVHHLYLELETVAAYAADVERRIAEVMSSDGEG